MKKLSIVITSILALSLSPFSVVAGPDRKGDKGGKGMGPKGGPPKLPEFSAIDTNEDGKITSKEFAETMLAEKIGEKFGAKAVGMFFDRRDANGDESIDPKEWNAEMQGKGGMGEKGGKSKGGGKGMGGKGGPEEEKSSGPVVPKRPPVAE